ncbi:MAG: helix-turn-helix transcriptional regulator [Firmicutes bacterium]|nr:helix-turn-helix transcriptional regulator [Bacillota bacterium]
MLLTTVYALVNLLLILIVCGGLVYLFILLVRALRKYLKSGEIRKENAAVRKSLGDSLKEHRVRCHMTQEFVAERLGVSRQAVSKWENGASDPSTSNLLALAKLYGVSAEELLKNVEA